MSLGFVTLNLYNRCCLVQVEVTSVFCGETGGITLGSEGPLCEHAWQREVLVEIAIV